MKTKSIIASILLALSIIGAKAQTSTNPVPQPVYQVFDFLRQGSNWIVAPYVSFTDDTKRFGGGLGLGYKLNDFVVPTLRLDYFNHDVSLISAQLQLQAPINLSPDFSITPLAYSGLITPLSGLGDANATAQGVFGGGAAFAYRHKFGLLGAVEYITGFENRFIRVGAFYRF